MGSGDRSIVAVYTLHDVGTSYGKAYTDLGRLTRSLNVPGGVRPAGTWFGTWSSGVNVRPEPNTTRDPLLQLHEWWAYLPQYGGYVSNIYMSSPDNQLTGVTQC
ncbi:hypothetical protein [Streptomyces griseorubiginosus]|uniref:hypothetical protein n=1 Tax=Streptomyces griseorubiginosus TaxID=67304 RepID=UPI0036E66F61